MSQNTTKDVLAEAYRRRQLAISSGDQASQRMRIPAVSPSRIPPPRVSVPPSGETGMSPLSRRSSLPQTTVSAVGRASSSSRRGVFAPISLNSPEKDPDSSASTTSTAPPGSSFLASRSTQSPLAQRSRPRTSATTAGSRVASISPVRSSIRQSSLVPTNTPDARNRARTAASPARAPASPARAARTPRVHPTPVPRVATPTSALHRAPPRSAASPSHARAQAAPAHTAVSSTTGMSRAPSRTTLSRAHVPPTATATSPPSSFPRVPTPTSLLPGPTAVSRMPAPPPHTPLSSSAPGSFTRSTTPSDAVVHPATPPWAPSASAPAPALVPSVPDALAHDANTLNALTLSADAPARAEAPSSLPLCATPTRPRIVKHPISPLPSAPHAHASALSRAHPRPSSPRAAPRPASAARTPTRPLSSPSPAAARPTPVPARGSSTLTRTASAARTPASAPSPSRIPRPASPAARASGPTPAPALLSQRSPLPDATPPRAQPSSRLGSTATRVPVSPRASSSARVPASPRQARAPRITTPVGTSARPAAPTTPRAPTRAAASPRPLRESSAARTHIPASPRLSAPSPRAARPVATPVTPRTRASIAASTPPPRPSSPRTRAAASPARTPLTHTYAPSSRASAPRAASPAASTRAARVSTSALSSSRHSSPSSRGTRPSAAPRSPARVPRTPALTSPSSAVLASYNAQHPRTASSAMRNVPRASPCLAPADTPNHASAPGVSAASLAPLEGYAQAGADDDLSLAALALGGLPLTARGAAPKEHEHARSQAQAQPRSGTISGTHSVSSPRIATPTSALHRAPPRSAASPYHARAQAAPVLASKHAGSSVARSPTRPAASPLARPTHSRARSPEPLPASVGSALPVVLRGKGRRRSLEQQQLALAPPPAAAAAPRSGDPSLFSPPELLAMQTGAGSPVYLVPSPHDTGSDTRTHMLTAQAVDALACSQSPQRAAHDTHVLLDVDALTDSPLFEPEDHDNAPELDLAALPPLAGATTDGVDGVPAQPLPFAMDVVRVGHERAAVDVLRAMIDEGASSPPLARMEVSLASLSLADDGAHGATPMSPSRRSVFSGMRSPIHSPAHAQGFSMRSAAADMPTRRAMSDAMAGLDAASAAAVAEVDAELSSMLASAVAGVDCADGVLHSDNDGDEDER